MLILMLRGLIIYVVVIASVRLMGKRQIGELQPSELVITILLSEVASMPLQDSEVPLLHSLVCIFLLVALEVVSSILSMKSRTFRTVMQGNSVLIITDGKVQQKNMRKIRYSVDDLMEALRLKDVFDIGQVQHAFVETNGAISVILKPEFRTVTITDTKIKEKPDGLPCLVISDGKLIEQDLNLCLMKKTDIEKILSKQKLTADQVLIMTCDKVGNINIIEKEEDNA
ncbi:MAG: DUF421 domain-containing protein [Clostridia bacterium]